MGYSEFADWSDQELVEELSEVESGLSDWELAFVDSIYTRIIDKRENMTDKRRHKCCEILSRINE